ncbi:histone-lysine N-methyltransferase ASHR2 [Coffea eugenioides]|uniref:histone-lysine N-methyltransferase ASHR2 n=1 Tax=Coffea eugenioides TaxID=49369 RepID=UPI000F613261|nr:histone-lysine N-methyltransferase ASHR2 [Coffea eugenioides]
MSETAESSAPLLKMVELEGKGRALVASVPLRAGQVVLRDSPILLYSALPLLVAPHDAQQNHNFEYCSQCFRLVAKEQPSSSCRCPSCSLSIFCSQNCQSLALSSSHTPWVCQALKQFGEGSSPLLRCQPDIQVQAHFLVAAYNLAMFCPSSFQTLLSLQGDPSTFMSSPEAKDSVFFLHSLVLSLPSGPVNLSTFGLSFSVELTAALLAKDKLNAFGLMEPFAPDKERSVRAYGIYPRASFFNHDCLPNACRFDYVDAATADGRNLDMTVRVIHDVPCGREISLSYFPVNLKYSERQKRLKEDYGFTCDCDRCRVEANWSDQEDEELDEDNLGDNEGAAMDEDDDDDDEEMVAEDGGSVAQDESYFPHAYFFLQYMCNKDNCWGTLAPLPPSDSSTSTVMECNVCGSLHQSKEVLDGNVAEQ